jgi:DNA-directed RNA polymerase specialized sigma24 family protein
LGELENDWRRFCDTIYGGRQLYRWTGSFRSSSMVFEGSQGIFSKIEPLFQDHRVGDADLVEVLVDESYTELYLLAQGILLDPELAAQSVKKAISTAVAQRRGYWGELPLAVWMNRLVLEQCSRRGWDGLVRPAVEQTRPPALDRDTGPEGPLPDFLDVLRKLSVQHRATLALRYGQQLTVEEIAGILDVPVVRARAFLKTAREACLDASDLSDSPSRLPALEGVSHTFFLEQIADAADGLLEPSQRSSIERHLGECQACRAQADDLAASNTRLREQILTRLGKKASQDDNHSLVLDCRELVNRQSLVSRLALSSRYILYTGVLLALLVGFAIRVILPLEDTPQPGTLVTLPAPTPTHDPWDGYIKFTYHVSDDDTLEDLAERAGLTVDGIRDLNRMSAGAQLYPGRVLTLALRESSFLPPSDKHEQVLPDRLTAQAHESAILERMAGAGDLISTLWGDYRYILYGPSGYSGPPYLEFRSQIWWHKDGYQVMINGLSRGMEGMNMQFSTPSRFTFNLDPSTNNLYAYNSQGENIFYFFQNPTQWLGLESSAAKFQVVGSDHILDYPVLVVDWVGENDSFAGRLWVDAERGLVLRMRIFEDADLQSTVMDWGFSDLALDVDLPARVFSPLSFDPGTFVRDYKAEPISEGEHAQEYPWSPPADRRPRERLSPPSGFDPAVEPLALQWPWNLLEGSELQVDVFAGEYFMGSLDLGPVPDVQDPDGHPSLPFDACTRSPDGRLAAFSVSRQSSFEPRIYWFNLAYPESYREAITEMDTLGEFAFDPSSRYLAFYGCSTGVCGIQVLDTYTEALRMLYSPRRAGPISLTWSPDGKYLAFVGSNPTSTMRKIFVVRVTNGAVVYEGDYGWEARSVPPDSPTLAWGKIFPEDESFISFFRGCRDPFEYPEWVEHDRRE